MFFIYYKIYELSFLVRGLFNNSIVIDFIYLQKNCVV